MTESEEQLKSLLMKVNEESEKVVLKVNIQITSPITSWQIDGETMATMRDFIFGGSKITAMVTAAMKLKDTCSWKKSYDQPRQHIKKAEALLCQKKVHQVKAMVFPVVMYGCESCTIKKAECRRTDAFELWCWRRLLRVQPVNPKGNKS